ncbi:hypothetical protein [Streptomyces chartreusis]|uniref:hypothetical protein n=1 Tax=Streptomyces chartreusis TaxID=1969 RepID=UPI0037DC9160|nr:hypothetical protein OG938_48480 [Streptomyces chartreusis]
MTDTAAERLAVIRDRAKAATEGPWQRDTEYGPNFFANIDGPYLQGVGDLNFGVGEQAEADEALVANAQKDIAWLLAYADGAIQTGRKQQEYIADLEAQLEKATADLQQSQTAFQSLARRVGMGIEPALEQCQAEYGGPGYTRCELADGHDGRHDSALGNLRRATWGGATDA